MIKISSIKRDKFLHDAKALFAPPTCELSEQRSLSCQGDTSCCIAGAAAEGLAFMELN